MGMPQKFGWNRGGVAVLNRKPAISLKRDKIGSMLLLMTNRKPHTRFRSVPKSTTLDDLESHYALRFKTRASFGAHHENVNEEKSSEQKLCSNTMLSIWSYDYLFYCYPFFGKESFVRFIPRNVLFFTSKWTKIVWRPGFFRTQEGRWKFEPLFRNPTMSVCTAAVGYPDTIRLPNPNPNP